MLIAVFGLWVFTNYELLMALFRLDERARAYFTASLVNVLLTIALTVWLVVVRGRGRARTAARQLRADRDRARRARVRATARRTGVAPGSGRAAPDAALRPADDAGRAVPVRAQLHRPHHARALRRAGGGRSLLAGGQVQPGRDGAGASLQPRLAARSPTRSATTTRRGAPTPSSSPTSCCSPRASCSRCRWRLAGSCGRWRRPSSSTPGRPCRWCRPASPSTRSSWCWSWLPEGPAARSTTSRSPPSPPATNVGLNLLLVPPHEIVGAGIALVGSYLVMLALMYAVTRRLFPVPFQWGRHGAHRGDRGRPLRARRDRCCRPRARRACCPGRRCSPAFPLLL